MPFIFHSKKQSIFDKKNQEQDCAPINLRCPDKQHTIDESNFIPISMTLCKQHPFRNFQQPQNKKKDVDDMKMQFDKENEEIITNEKHSKSRVYKSRQVIKVPQQSNFQNPTLSIDVKNNTQGTTQTLSSHHKSRISQKFINQQTSSFKRPIYLSQQRLKYAVKQQIPGPGAYNPLIDNKSSSNLMNYPLTKTYPLPQKNDNSLIDYINSFQKKVDKKISQRKFAVDCSYKNQSSPCFKTSVINGVKKNSSLFSMLFSSKGQKNTKDNQSQTTCQSRINYSENKISYLDDDQFIKVEDKSPSPCSYDPNLEITIKEKTNKNKQSKVFISGSPKFLDLKKRQVSPGPGQYQCFSNQKNTQNGQSFNQNQNKRPNKFVQDQQNNPSYVFSSSIPRQLDFGMGQKGKQQLYYSPKTTLADNLKQKQNKSTLSNQFYFGSSLQRFPKDDIVEEDPYKYCFAKIKVMQQNSRKSGGVIISSKGKRQLFTDIKPQNNNPSPSGYDNKTNTVQKSSQNILQKLQRKSRYNQQVLQLREKKQHMEKVLIQERSKSIDLKTIVKPKQQLYPDSYKEYLLSKKRIQKKNISFGYNKNSNIDRAFKPKEEVDGYYETQPGWEVKSFNKQYGYQVYQ